jgi:hypothetical protein
VTPDKQQAMGSAFNKNSSWSSYDMYSRDRRTDPRFQVWKDFQLDRARYRFEFSTRRTPGWWSHFEGTKDAPKMHGSNACR